MEKRGWIERRKERIGWREKGRRGRREGPREERSKMMNDKEEGVVEGRRSRKKKEECRGRSREEVERERRTHDG